MLLCHSKNRHRALFRACLLLAALSVVGPGGATSRAFGQAVARDAVEADVTAAGGNKSPRSHPVGARGRDHAAFVSQFVPSVMTAGQTVGVAVRLRNDGDTMWTPTGSAPYRLGFPDDTTLWGLSRVALPRPVPSGGSVTFYFPVTAPSTPGTYRFAWQMVRENVGFFDGVTPAVNVSVRRGNDAAFVSQSVPAAMEAGQAYRVSVTMRNSGVSDWGSQGLYAYRLGAESRTDNTVWGLHRVALPAGPVAPGASATFTFTVTAPTAAGVYPFRWRMVQEYKEHFGAYSPAVEVAVGDVMRPVPSPSRPR